MDTDILNAVNELKRKVDDLSAKVVALEKRWQYVTSVALLLVGAVGGPNAVNLITGGAG
jgi:hypothetical protein